MSMNARIRSCAVLATAPMAAVALLTTCLDARAQTRVQPVACEEWAITSVDPRNNGRLQVCSSVLREVPELRAQIERLNSAAGKNAQSLKQLEGFSAALNELTRELRSQDRSRMAANLAQRIGDTSRESDARLLREVEKLRLGIADINERLDAAGGDLKAAAQVRAAVAGEAGEAIVRLDFAAANKILESLARVETGVDEIRGRDTVRGIYASNPELLNQIRSGANGALARLDQMNGRQRCGSGWQLVSQLAESARQAERSGDLNVAGATYKEVVEQAEGLISELTAIDSTRQAQENFQAAIRTQYQQMERHSYELASKFYEDQLAMSQKFARTGKLQEDLARARQLRVQAEALAREGRWYDAVDQTIAAANLLRQIENEGGNYRFPLTAFPNPLRVTPPRAETSASWFPTMPNCR